MAGAAGRILRPGHGRVKVRALQILSPLRGEIRERGSRL